MGIVTILTGVFSIFTSGAGGGILGGIFGLFKRSQDRKERVELARLNLERDQLEYAEARNEREHALTLLKANGDIELEKIQTEAEAEMEVAHQSALSNAQGALKRLKTTSSMDNYRASIRPTLALWAAILFSGMLGWAFYSFRDLITIDEGKTLLLGMFATLNFIVTSVVSFYYVSRRDDSPKV